MVKAYFRESRRGLRKRQRFSCKATCSIRRVFADKDHAPTKREWAFHEQCYFLDSLWAFGGHNFGFAGASAKSGDSKKLCTPKTVFGEIRFAA